MKTSLVGTGTETVNGNESDTATETATESESGTGRGTESVIGTTDRLGTRGGAQGGITLRGPLLHPDAMPPLHHHHHPCSSPLEDHHHQQQHLSQLPRLNQSKSRLRKSASNVRSESVWKLGKLRKPQMLQPKPQAPLQLSRQKASPLSNPPPSPSKAERPRLPPLLQTNNSNNQLHPSS